MTTSSYRVVWAAVAGAVLWAVVLWTLIRLGGVVLFALVPPELAETPGQAWLLLKLCLGVAALTMPLVQIVRTLWPIRGYFHRAELCARWKTLADLSNPTSDRDDDLSPDDDDFPSQKTAELFRELHLSRISPTVAQAEFERREDRDGPKSPPTLFLYDIPVEQLAGQLSLALDTALDQPRRYRHLLLCTFGPSAAGVLLKAIRPVQPAAVVSAPKSSPGAEETMAIDAAMEQAEARAAIMRLSQSEIDAFQIAVGGRWRRLLRLSVVLLSVLCSLILTTATLWTRHQSVGHRLVSILLYSILEGLIAGYLAMLLRDIIAIIEAQRRRA